VSRCPTVKASGGSIKNDRLALGLEGCDTGARTRKAKFNEIG